tara:strand:- start:233 stop:556 length:324 start_codon:yes stop_codon:yes gene_type:complete
VGLSQVLTFGISILIGSLENNLFSQSIAIKKESVFKIPLSSELITEYLVKTKRLPFLLYLIELGSIDNISLLSLDTSIQSISSANIFDEVQKSIMKKILQKIKICLI